MHTNDFKEYGSFYINKEGTISFVTLSEKQIFEKRNFINSCGFEKFDSVIDGAFLEKKTSFYDFVNITKSLQFLDIPLDLSNAIFPSLLHIHTQKLSGNESNLFPLSQVAKAFLVKGVDFIPFKTEQRLVITDYGSKLPSKGDIVVFPTVVKNYKTVYPKSFDSWVSLLLKAKEFKTVNKEFLMIKSLFDIK